MNRTAGWRLVLRRSTVTLCIGAAAVLCSAAPTASAVSGSIDDWLEAVCQPDRIFDRSNSHIVSGDVCVPHSGFGYVNFEYYRSDVQREQILGLSTSAHIARFRSGDLYGAIWTPAGDGNVLAPLKQFGFTIEGPSRKNPPRVDISPKPDRPTAVPSTPKGSESPEQQFLAAANDYLTSPRPPDTFVLERGQQACAVRRDGGSSDDAEVAIWKAWNASGLGPPSGAETGSLVHTAIDYLCPEVG